MTAWGDEADEYGRVPLHYAARYEEALARLDTGEIQIMPIVLMGAARSPSATTTQTIATLASKLPTSPDLLTYLSGELSGLKLDQTADLDQIDHTRATCRKTGQVWVRTLRYVRAGNLISSDHLPTQCQEVWSQSRVFRFDTQKH